MAVRGGGMRLGMCVATGHQHWLHVRAANAATPAPAPAPFPTSHKPMAMGDEPDHRTQDSVGAPGTHFIPAVLWVASGDFNCPPLSKPRRAE
jgi:hypothetical protein